jgi:hypothetical protein
MCLTHRIIETEIGLILGFFPTDTGEQRLILIMVTANVNRKMNWSFREKFIISGMIRRSRAAHAPNRLADTLSRPGKSLKLLAIEGIIARYVQLYFIRVQLMHER